jgi:hypothetical protein
VTSFHTDQRGYAVVLVSFYYLWNRHSIKVT